MCSPTSPQLLVLGSWVDARRLFQLSLFLTAPRMDLPQDPGADPKCLRRYAIGLLVQSTLRDLMAKVTLDDSFSSREEINEELLSIVSKARMLNTRGVREYNTIK